MAIQQKYDLFLKGTVYQWVLISTVKLCFEVACCLLALVVWLSIVVHMECSLWFLFSYYCHQYRLTYRFPKIVQILSTVVNIHLFSNRPILFESIMCYLHITITYHCADTSSTPHCICNSLPLYYINTIPYCWPLHCSSDR